MFTPSRLTLARERRRLTKKGLAQKLRVTPHTVLRYESGEMQPTDDVVDRMENVLGFPRAFFFRTDIDGPNPASASFRSLSTISAKERDSALAAGAFAFDFSDWVDDHFDLPDASLVDLAEDTPEVAARSLREEWGLGEKPIPNLVHLLESKGVRVFSMAENTLAVDAFSVWRGARPFVFLNTIKSAERSRHDAAHELGHLVLHKHGGPQGRGVEDEADQFASSFLMPEEDVRATLPRVHTLNQLLEAKKRWGVSLMSLVVRLHRLRILSDWQYRMFCIDASERGYRTAEPQGMPREQSIVWQKVLTALWAERTTKESIARDLALPIEELENLLFGLTATAHQQGAIRPPLRLVSE